MTCRYELLHEVFSGEDVLEDPGIRFEKSWITVSSPRWYLSGIDCGHRSASSGVM